MRKLILGLSLVVFLFSMSGCSSDSDSPKTLEDYKGILWGCAKDAVKQNLKSPSTAEFPFSYNDATFSILGNDTYSVKSWVDSQNGFGATIRSNFTVTICRVGDDAFQAQDVKIE